MRESARWSTRLARGCQPGHACTHAVRGSLSRTDSHWTPLQRSCRAADPCGLIIHTHKCMHAQVKHTPHNYTAIHMWFHTLMRTLAHKFMYTLGLVNTNKLEVRIYSVVTTECGSSVAIILQDWHVQMCVKVSPTNHVIQNGPHYMHINTHVHSWQTQRRNSSSTHKHSRKHAHMPTHRESQASCMIKPGFLGDSVLSYCQILLNNIAKLH